MEWVGGWLGLSGSGRGQQRAVQHGSMQRRWDGCRSAPLQCSAQSWFQPAAPTSRWSRQPPSARPSPHAPPPPTTLPDPPVGVAVNQNQLLLRFPQNSVEVLLVHILKFLPWWAGLLHCGSRGHGHVSCCEVGAGREAGEVRRQPVMARPVGSLAAAAATQYSCRDSKQLGAGHREGGAAQAGRQASGPAGGRCGRLTCACGAAAWLGHLVQLVAQSRFEAVELLQLRFLAGINEDHAPGRADRRRHRCPLHVQPARADPL